MSRGAILGFQELVRSFEQQYGRPLRFRELVKAGFTLPVSTVDKDDLVVSLNDRVIDYLNRCIQKINKEQRRTVCLFDMDGTLYRLDGVGSGYAGSSLEKRVRNNATAFIAAQENCSFDQANVVYESGIADRIGLSSYLSRRYDISRSDYFDTVWNIDPSPIVEQYEIPVRVLRELKQSTVKPVLLTSAPRVWMKRVLETLEIDNVFELTYSGEQFGTKSEIFARLAGWYTPTNIISIGDQEQTDIAPAKAYGFRTLLVSSPADVQNLLEAI
jgi:FMN phosphatase YigB (HAD superfamily)